MYDFSKRRSIRRYKTEDVSDDLLNSLLMRASHTQTMGNLQLYSVVVTRNQDIKRQLSPAHYNQPMVTQAPVVLTFCADFRRTTDWALQRNANPGYDNLLSFQNACTDTLLYCQTFCNMAEEEGLGLCFLGTTLYNSDAIIDILQLPVLTFPVATITLGWPDEEGKVSDRLPLCAIRHDEVYRPFNAERINASYSEREALEESKHFVEENHKDNLAQVFTDIRYSADDNLNISVALDGAMRRQGFQGSLIGEMTRQRPESLECDIVRFQNKKERWVAFVGLWKNRPYEIFTGILDDDDGIMIPKSVSKGYIVKRLLGDGSRRYDFQFVNKRGYKITIEGLSERFNPEYWNYAKLISGVLRYGMPLERVIALIKSLQLDSDNINSWTSGVAKALKRYINGGQLEDKDTETQED